jgi:1A family penicillin-binding protein
MSKAKHKKHELARLHKHQRVTQKIKLHVWHGFKSFVLGFALIWFLLIMGAVGMILYYNATLPDIHDLAQRDAPQSTKIYSRDGTLLYEVHGEFKRTRVNLDQINPHLKHATIAIEDKDFYKHGAISPVGIIRAIIANYRSGTVSEGGSTITQQFVKNAMLSRERSFARKAAEIVLAHKLEEKYSKDEILTEYLNEIPYGRNAYGAEAAAKAYFDKSASELTLVESAYLAALPQAPSYYSSSNNAEAWEARKNKVLDLMFEQNYIDWQQHGLAKEEKVAFRQVKTSIIAPHFVTWVQNTLTEKYGRQFLEEGGLKVHTSLDLRLQSLAEQVVKEGATLNAQRYGAYNAALVAVEPASGKVLAMVGGKDYFGTPEPAGCRPGVNCKFEPAVNVATSNRQPGSSFKPYAYVTSFKPEFGYSPASRILDAPITFAGGYSPQNYDGGFRGWTTIRKALAGSLNVPAVKVVAAVGVKNVVETAKGLGITSPMQNCGLSLVLGGCEVKLVDHTAAYAALGNMGKFNGNTPFLRIEDKRGNVLEEYQEQNKQVVNPEAAYELINIMTDDASRQYIFGRNNPLNLPGRPVACKTGTTQSWKDGWTLCFTPQLAVGVWTGNNDSSLMKAGSDGVFTAAPIWRKFMEQALASQPVQDWPVPQGIVQIRVDKNTGRPLYGRNAASGRLDPFAWYAIPPEFKTSATPRSVTSRVGRPNQPGPQGATAPKPQALPAPSPQLQTTPSVPEPTSPSSQNTAPVNSAVVIARP